MRHPSSRYVRISPFDRFIAGCFLLCIFAISAHAQVTINPRFVFMHSTERSVKINVFNQLDQTVESWVEVRYGYPVMDDTGKPIIVGDSNTVAANDASKWIKVFPKRFTMDEKGQQTLRVTVTPPATLVDGEYWARVMVFAKLAKETITPRGSTHTANVVKVTSMDVPFHFRVGKVSSSVSLDNPALAELNPHKLRLDVDVKKEGNAAFWGTLTLRLIDRQNNVVMKSDKPFVAYSDYHFITKFDSVTVPSGEYTAQIVVATKRSDLSSAKLIQARSIERTFPYTRP